MPDLIYETLYHPSYIPDENWTKLQLLYWDKIYRIVPIQMKDLYGDNIIDEKFKIDPAILPPLSPDYQDLDYFDQNKAAIKKAFDNIKQDQNLNSQSLENFGVHPGKAPAWIFNYLEELQLAKLIEEGVKDWPTRHHNVNPTAGELILSCVGSSMAERYNMSAITERESNFYLTAANNINRSLTANQKEMIYSNLGYSVLDAKVPKDINKLSMSEILKLKNDYQDLKVAFHSSMKNLSTTNSFNDVQNQKDFRDRIENCVATYKREYEKFDSHSQKFLRSIKDWKIQSVGAAVGTFGKEIAPDPLIGYSLKIIGFGVTLLGRIPIKSYPEETKKSFQYLQKIDETVEAKVAIQNIKPYLLNVKI